MTAGNVIPLARPESGPLGRHEPFGVIDVGSS
jgi:hypothetical protein